MQYTKGPLSSLDSTGKIT